MLSESTTKSEKLLQKQKGFFQEHTNIKNAFRLMVTTLAGHLLYYLIIHSDQMSYDNEYFRVAITNLFFIVMILILGEFTPLIESFVQKTIELFRQATNPLVTSIQKEVDRDRELMNTVTDVLKKYLPDLQKTVLADIIKSFELYLEKTHDSILAKHGNHIEVLVSQAISHFEELTAKLEEYHIPEELETKEAEIKALKEKLATLED